MKKITLSFLFLISISLLSCDQQSLPLNTSCTDLLLLSDFDDIGQMHNDFLQNFHDNFDPEDYPSTLSFTQRIDVANNFNKSYAATLNLSSTDLTLLNTALDASKKLLELDENYEKNFVDATIVSGYDSYEILSYLETNNAIDAFEKELLIDVLNLCYANKIGNIDEEGMKSELLDLREKWTDQQYKVCDNTGVLSAYILSIGLCSVDWWIDHPEVYSNGERIAPWVAADITGAVWGAFWGVCGQVANQPYRPNGPAIVINWGSVAWAAAGGAISGSTGLTGKLTKLLFG